MPLTSIQCWHVHCEECWLRTLVRLLASCMGAHNTLLFPNMVPIFSCWGQWERHKRLVEDGEKCKILCVHVCKKFESISSFQIHTEEKQRICRLTRISSVKCMSDCSQVTKIHVFGHFHRWIK